MNLVGQWLPVATLLLIIGLIVRSRVARGGPRVNVSAWIPRPRPKKPPGKLLPFDRAKMDDDLNALLRKRR